MTFLLPIGLLALLTLPVIALLHLIQQRRDRMRVPSIQIWRDLQRQTVQQKPRRLPLSLLLLLHLLLAALLAFALGQPFWQAVRGQATHTVLLVDTSTSMAATDETESRLQAAKVEARRAITSLRRGDTAALINLRAQPGIVAQGTSNDTSALLAQLNQLQPGGPDGDLQAALGLAQATAKPNANTRIVVLTDQALRTAPTVTVAGNLDWRTFGSQEDNAAIVAFAARPLRNGRQQLYARVANLGTVPIARTLQLNLDGKRAADEPMRLAPGAEAEWSWPLPAGTSRAEATMSGDDSQPIDDRAAVVLGSNIQTRVTLVTAITTPLERALRAQRGLVVERITPAQYQPSLETDLVVFNAFVPSEMPDAAVLVVSPPPDQTLITVEEEVFDLKPAAATDDRFAAVEWKPVTFERVSRVIVPAWANVAVTSGDVPLVLTGQYNNQPIVIWSFDPAASNLPNRLAFPLLTAATTRQLLPQANDRLLVGATSPFTVVAEDGTTIAVGGQLARPGIYRVQGGDELLAVNALDADESNLQQRAQPTITELPQQVMVNDTPVGRELWQPVVIAALLVLIFEWLYSNRRVRMSSVARMRPSK